MTMLRGMGESFDPKSLQSNPAGGASSSPLNAPLKPPEPEIPPTSVQEPKAPSVPDVWADKPSVYEQRERHPQTVRLTGTITKIFNLSDDKELAAYNAIQADSGHFSDPNITVIIVSDQISRNPSTGKFDAVLQWRKFQFLQIAPKPSEPKS